MLLISRIRIQKPQEKKKKKHTMQKRTNSLDLIEANGTHNAVRFEKRFQHTPRTS